MKWNAFEFITPAINKTKKRLLPFSFKEWLKLGIISGLASGGGFSGNFSSFNGDFSSVDNSNLTFEQMKNRLREYIKNYWIIGTIILGFFLILGVIWSYITSVFSFIFIESVLGKEAKFNFRKNKSKGISLFLFRLVFGFISLGIIILLAFPYVSNFMKGNPIVASVGVPYIIFSILFLLLSFIVLWFLQLFVEDFVTAFIYSKSTGAWFSWKQIWKLILKNKKESFIYWLARLLLGMAVGIIGLIIVVAIIVVIVIASLLIFLMGLFIFGKSLFLTIVGIVLLVIILIIFILAIIIATMPLRVFNKYFYLLNFEKLTGIKILK